MEYKARQGGAGSRASYAPLTGLRTESMCLTWGLVALCISSMLSSVEMGNGEDIDVSYADSYYNEISEDDPSEGKASEVFMSSDNEQNFFSVDVEV